MKPPALPMVVNCVVESKDNGALTITNYVDTKGYQWARFIICSGHIEVDSAVDPKITECATSGGSYADITNATVAVEAADDDGKWVIDVKCGGSRLRYLKVAATAGDGSGTAGEYAVICLLYHADTYANTYADAGLTASGDWVVV